MTAKARLGKLRSIVALLTAETRFATNLQCLFARCADKPDVLDPFGHEPEVWGFTSTRDAIHMALISTLGRIHDSAKSDGACFAAARACLADSGVRNLIIEMEVPEDMDSTAELIQSVLPAMDDPDLQNLVGILREVRDKRVAHRDHHVRAYRAKYGDERKLLEMTIPIVHDLGSIVFGTNTHLRQHQSKAEKLADRFWRTVAAGQKRQKAARKRAANG
jgi:hypothetical protein